MNSVRLPTKLMLALLAVATLVALAGSITPARADEEASWRLEQPMPPELPTGQKAERRIGLGKIGDIEFYAPNRGVLITAGNGSTVPAGVWYYNGVQWRELSEVCGGTNGRIAWAGPSEFWTVSDGRLGQVNLEGTPPLEDNTLCHFAPNPGTGTLEVVTSYASLAFEEDSYQAMDGAACITASDCWFGGAKLPDGLIGAFQLHWNGTAVKEEPGGQDHAVGAIASIGGSLIESVQVTPEDQAGKAPESPSEPSLLHEIEPEEFGSEQLLLNPRGPVNGGGEANLPAYFVEEDPSALEAARLGADGDSLWAAFDPLAAPPEGVPGEVTILRESGGAWEQVIGPLSGGHFEGSPFTSEPGASKANEQIESIAPEPVTESEQTEDTEHAWLALASRQQELEGLASVARISSSGEVTERMILPSGAEKSEGVENPGNSAHITCPSAHDCWLATSRGWLYHLARAGEETLAPDGDAAFSTLITVRPEDEGVPKTVPDAPPEDDSGLLGELQTAPLSLKTGKEEGARREVALITHLTSRLVHGTTLELRFHLAVKARLQLVARRKGKVVAHTAMVTLKKGERHLLLALERKRWPTHLQIKQKALAKLPTVPISSGPLGSNTVTTILRPASPLASIFETASEG